MSPAVVMEYLPVPDGRRGAEHTASPGALYSRRAPGAAHLEVRVSGRPADRARAVGPGKVEGTGHGATGRRGDG